MDEQTWGSSVSIENLDQNLLHPRYKQWTGMCWEGGVYLQVFDYSEPFFALIGDDLGDNLIAAWDLKELSKWISFFWMLSLSY